MSEPTLEEVKNKLELQKRKQDIAVIQQMVEPLAEAIEELNTTIKTISNKKPEEKPEPEYFDKELGSKLEKVFSLWEKFKPQKIDLSPITSIATEIKNQNTSIEKLINNLPKQDTKGYESLVREVLAMVQRSNDFISKGFTQIDYSKQLENINSTIAVKPVYEFTIERSKHDNTIDKVIATPIYKK